MRTVLALIILAGSAMMPAWASDHDANFLIKRAGKVIGYHVVDVTETETGAIVETRIRMRVKFGPIPLFKYDHSAVEEWRDGQLYSLQSETNNNGEDLFASVSRIDGQLVIEGSGYEGAAPLSALPSSYWNKALTDAETMINTQTGELIEISVAEMGKSYAPHGAPAEQFRLTGTLDLDLWYDGTKWVGSDFTIDGEKLTYELEQSAQEFAQLAD